MGKVRLRHYRDTGLHRVVNRPLRATVPPGAKMHPAMRDLLAKMAQARRRDFSFASRYRLRRKPPPVGEAFTQALPERYAVRTGKLAISFLRNGSREPNAGIPWRWDTMRHGAAGLLLAERLRQLRPTSLFYRRQPPFLAIGDRIVVVYQRKDNDVQALYNVSDGGAFLKNHPCYPGDRQMSLVYNLFYGMVLVIYLLILGMSLNNPYKPARDLGG